MERVLIFAPHPDDDVIACGGTIAKHVQKGDSVAIVYLSSGEAGSLVYPPADLSLRREAEARQASAVLGVTDLVFLRFPDGYISFQPEYLECLIKLIREKKPTLIYLPHALESVRDHQVTHQLVSEAAKRAAGPWFQNCGNITWSTGTILGYEVWTPLPNYNWVEDISDFMEIKLAALRKHQSQIETIAYDEAIKGLNRYRGVMSKAGQYCECFQIINAHSGGLIGL